MTGEIDAQRMAEHDPGGMYGMIASLGDQFEDGWRAASETLAGVKLLPAGRRPTGVVVCGMGGSAIGADVVRAACPDLSVPFEVVRGYDLPAWVTPEALVITVSYSGNTEEALACLNTALERGCAPVCIASGGAMAGIAGERGLPLLDVPRGYQPRAALGLLATQVAAAVVAAGLTDSFDEQVAETADVLRTMRAELAPVAGEAENRAEELARYLCGRVTLICGGGVTAVAARRWKGQINENAKALAFFAELPELDHNELMGWTSDPLVAGNIHIVVLEDPSASDELVRRTALTARYLSVHAAGVAKVATRGVSPLARACSAIYMGDHVSFYMALLYGVDPTPVAAIETFKQRLAEKE